MVSARIPAGALFWLWSAAAAGADVIVLRDGPRVDGLIVEADDQSILVRHGAGRATISRRIPRSHILTIQLSPTEVWTLREQAWRAEREGAALEAASAWQIICGLHPESVEDQLRRADCLRRAGRPQDAARAAEAAGRLDPGNGRALLEEGEARPLSAHHPARALTVRTAPAAEFAL